MTEPHLSTRDKASSSSVIPLDPLKALSARWREWSLELGEGNDFHLSRRQIATRCADELDALLAVSSQDGK